jgi:AcrR family transcriptional regulator
MSRERQILDAAAELFYESSYHGVGVDAIGDRAGLSGPAIYRHFSGKDEILATLLTETLDGLISSTAVISDDPGQDLERLIRQQVDFTMAHRHLINIYQREVRTLAEPWRRQYVRRLEHYASRWEAAIARCYPQASPDAVTLAAQAALGLVHSVTFWPPAALAVRNVGSFVVRMVSQTLTALAEPSETSSEEPVPPVSRPVSASP